MTDFLDCIRPADGTEPIDEDMDRAINEASLCARAERGWRWREVDSTDSQLHSAERTPPCRKRTWCCKPEHSEDEPCEEVPRRDIPRSDFGPKAAEKRRWG